MENKVGNMSTVKDVSIEEGHVDSVLAHTLQIQKQKVIMDIIATSFSFMLLFTAYQSVAFLQSSINKVNVFNEESHNFTYIAIGTLNKTLT